MEKYTMKCQDGTYKLLGVNEYKLFDGLPEEQTQTLQAAFKSLWEIGRC